MTTMQDAAGGVVPLGDSPTVRWILVSSDMNGNPRGSGVVQGRVVGAPVERRPITASNFFTRRAGTAIKGRAGKTGRPQKSMPLAILLVYPDSAILAQAAFYG